MRSSLLMAGIVVSALGVNGCGYTMVKKNDLRFQRLATDSVTIAALRARVNVLETRVRADSARYAALAVRAVMAGATADTTTPIAVRDREIAELKEQLARAQAELERIKRRLVAPRS